MDSPSYLFETFVILALIVCNGFLAMAELAIVSARKTRLQQQAETGNKGAALALDLANSPSDFLAAIQIGITLVGVLAGAFGGASLASKLAPTLEKVEILAPYAEGVSFVLIVFMITFLTLIFGELVPKRIALIDPEKFARFMSRPVRWISLFAMPLVRLLSLTTDAVLRLFRIRAAERLLVTEEEVKIMIEQGAEQGVFEKEEESMMKRVLMLGDRRAGELMTQRFHMVTLDIDAPLEANLSKMIDTPHSYFPARRRDTEEFVGFISAKCVLSRIAGKKLSRLEDCLVKPLYVTESMPALKLLDSFKKSGQSRALVVDEYGTTSGMVTVADVLETVSGDLPTEGQQESNWAVQREDGTWLIDGALPIYELCDLLGVSDPHHDIEGDYQTVAGLTMTKLGHIPTEGERFSWNHLHFEVMDMDGNRVDKLMITVESPHESDPEDGIDP